MRIAIVCSKYALEEKNAWLTNDLAYAYRDLGHEVFIYCLAWSGEQPSQNYTDNRGIVINYISQPNWQKMFGKKLGIVVKWFFSSWWASRKINVPDKNIDLLIYFSPAVTTVGIVAKLKKYSSKVVMILWDFFPQYHQELNLLPNNSFIINVAKKQEQYAVNKANLVGLMTPKNIRFMNEYFPHSNQQKRVVIQLWGPNPLAITNLAEKLILKRQWPQLDSQKIWAVMGGQMIPGRGFELLLNVAALSEKLDNQINFVVAGDGILKQWFLEKMQEKQLTNVNYVGSLSRDKYFALLQAADIGLVFNSGHVSVPTFASKSIDYLRAAIPLLVAIEPASDAGIIIEEEMQAGYNCDVNNPNDIVDKLMFLAENPLVRQMMGNNGYDYFMKNMTANKIAEKIVSESGLQ